MCCGQEAEAPVSQDSNHAEGRDLAILTLGLRPCLCSWDPSEALC